MRYLCLACGHNGHYHGSAGIGKCISVLDSNGLICGCPRVMVTNLDYLELKYEQRKAL